MRKTIISLMAFLIIAVQPFTALAATSAELLPSTIDLSYQIDVSKLDMLHDYILEAVKSDLTTSQSDLVESILANSTFDFSMNIKENTDFSTGENLDIYLSFQISEDDLSTLLNEINADYTETQYNEDTIYDFSDSFGTYLNGIFYVTTAEESAKQLIDNQSTPENTLAENTAYQNASQYFLQDAFLNMYINPGELLKISTTNSSYTMGDSLMEAQGYSEDFLNALISEAVSVAQTDSGFDFQVYVEGDTEKLTELDMLMNKFNFTPKLYKMVSGTDLIMYSEGTNIEGAIDNMLNVSTTDSVYHQFYNAMAEGLNGFSEQDLRADILALLDSNYMFTVHDSGQIIPSFTMIFDSSEHKALAKTNVAILNEKIRTMLLDAEQSSGESFYTYGTTTIGDQTLPKHIIDLKTLMGDDTMIKTSELRLNLTFGVTEDGMIIVSTHPDLNSIWTNNSESEGVLSNSGLAEAWTDPTKVVTEVAYFDVDGINSYLTEMLPKAETPEGTVDFFAGLLEPWHSIFSTSEATENTAIAKGSVKVDIEKFADYPTLFTEYTKLMEETSRQSYLSYSDAFACDVSNEDWFREPVVLLRYDNIVSGYSDGCFHPENDITRAEFTKMVYTAAEKAGLTGSIAMSDADKYFSDVDAGQWYAFYINQAAANKLVNGYEDGTFHPNAPISRAEAVQILYNASEMIRTQTESKITTESNFGLPFSDVNLQSDWYGHAVAGMYMNNIVSGTGENRFEPARNINRAEAAKIIYLFLELNR